MDLMSNKKYKHHEYPKETICISYAMLQKNRIFVTVKGQVNEGQHVVRAGSFTLGFETL